MDTESNVSPLSVFEEIKLKNGEVSENMHKQLYSLFKLLKSLERNTLPLHQETSGLQNHLKNIDEALKNVSLIMGYYQVHGKYAGILFKQPILDVPKHLSALKEIKEAEEFFNSGAFGTEAKELKNDFAKGNENLFAHFRSELHALGELDEALILQLHRYTDEFIQRSESELNQRFLAGDRNIGDLKDVVFWLCRGFSEGFDIVSSYSSARSDFFAQMLKAYADRCRNHSATEKHKTTDFNFLITSQKSELPRVPRYHQRYRSRLVRTVGVNPSVHMESVGLGNDTIMGSLLGKAADGISNVIDTGVGGVKKVGVLTTDVVVGTGDVVHKMASETAGVVTTTLSAMPLVSGAMPLSHSEQKNSFLPDPSLSDVDVMVYVQIISAFHVLAVNEFQLVGEIVPRNKVSQAYEALCKETAKKLRFDIEKLIGVCTARMKNAKTDLRPIQCLFPLAEFIRLKFFVSGLATSESDLNSNQTRISPTMQKELLFLYRKVTDALKFCLDVFYENIKSENRVVPVDATVDELTVKSMTYLDLILFYRSLYAVIVNFSSNSELARVASAVLTGDNSGKPQFLPREFYQMDATREREIISSLFSCLCSKLSPALSKSTPMDDNRDKLFIFNNLNFVLDSIKRFDVAEISCCEPVQEAIARNVQVIRMDFMSCWRKLNNNLNRKPNIAPSELKVYKDKINTGRLDQIKMTDVERESLKNLFSTFNTDFEVVTNLHKTLSIPSQAAYEDIRAEIETIIVQPYAKFYNEYHQLPFTKFREKYVKFTPDSLVRAIDECYGYRI